MNQTSEKRVLIMGAGGRDFHTFLTVYRDDPEVRIVGFTATQIPFIADRSFPAALSGERYPDGLPIFEEEDLVEVIGKERVEEVVFAYSDVALDYVEEKRAFIEETGARFVPFDVDRTMVESTKPVIAVTAVRTGCGKSAVSRAVVSCLKERGLACAAIRHPMPYGDLKKQAVQRFETLEDLDTEECTIEEREEYEPHIMAGSVVFAGVDYESIVRRAEEEVDVVVWDGGNNDSPFYRPDLWIVIADPLRPGDELSYFPGRTNFERADVIVLNKIESAQPEGLETVRHNARQVNPMARILESRMPVTLTDEEAAKVKGARVLVIEDGPTVTHGGMKTGAGTIAAELYGAAEIVDPRPFLTGLLKETFAEYPGIGRLLPAMGYSDQQIADLQATVNSSDADLVVVGTPINLGRLIRIDKPHVWARYDVEFQGRPDLCDVIEELLEEKGLLSG
ncbi:MAG: GTPase [Planctomycetota bacterium]